MQMLEFFRTHGPLIHAQNVSVGWYDEDRSFATYCCLFNSEIFEGFEGVRRNLMDDKLPQYPMIAVELADKIIRGLDYLAYRNYAWGDMKGVRFIKVTACMHTNLMNMSMLVSEAWLHNGSEISLYQLQRAIVLAYQTAEYFGWDIQRIILEKTKFNKTRADHQRKNRTGKPGEKTC